MSSKDSDRPKQISLEFMSVLRTLTVNSKPLIITLTKLAKRHKEYAHVVFATIEKHVSSVMPDYKLLALYLIDSILKTIQACRNFFNMKTVNLFCDVFNEVGPIVRGKMLKLRQQIKQNSLKIL